MEEYLLSCTQAPASGWCSGMQQILDLQAICPSPGLYVKMKTIPAVVLAAASVSARDTGEDSICPFNQVPHKQDDQREAQVQVNEGFLWTRSHTRDTAVSCVFVLREQHGCAQTGSPQRAQIGKPLMLIHGRQRSVPLLMKPREWCCRGTQVEKQPEKDAIYSPASTFSSYWSIRWKALHRSMAADGDTADPLFLSHPNRD